MISTSHSRSNVSAVCVLLLLIAKSANGYYGRSRQSAAVSFSTRAQNLSGSGTFSSAFFAFGGWSGGGSYNNDDIKVTRNVRASYYNNRDDPDVEGDSLPLMDDEDNPSTVVQAEAPIVPQTPKVEEDIPLAALKTRPYTRRIGVWVKVRIPSKKRSSSKIASLEDRKPSVPEPPVTMLDKETIRVAVSQPVISEDAWNQMTGDEFEDPSVVDALVKAGFQMATKHDENGWVDWDESLPSNLDTKLDDGEVLVYTGSASRPGFGSDVPWIKSVSTLPMTASEGAKLMMDSTRVKAYNNLSLGRDDIKTLKTSQSSNLSQESKIVRNVVQLPVTNSKVESVTMLHTRQLPDGSHLLVSRAVGGTKYASADSKVGKSYILMGVNLFSPVKGSPDECRMIAVTHAYSPGLPLMLARKVGVKSAKNFIKDIRAMCERVSQ